jgi:NitT/TauT family transport system substrate-binding protein
LADLSAFIRFRDRPDAVPMKAVFILHEAVGYAIIARRSRGIATLEDLKGKTLGVAENDIAIRLWPALASRNAFDAQSVKIERIGAAVREPMLSAGQVDAVNGYSFLSAVNLRDRGIPADDLNVIRFADHGIAAYGQALIVNTAFAIQQPEALRGLLRGLTKALQLTVKDPAGAIADLMGQTSGLTRSLESERLATVLRDCIATPAARRNGLGDAEPARLERGVAEIAEDFKFRQKPLPSDIFDSTFLPPASQRRIDETASR